MPKKKNMLWNWVSMIAILVGGLVHLLSAYETYDLLGALGGSAQIIQLIVGAITVISVLMMLKKK